MRGRKKKHRRAIDVASCSPFPLFVVIAKEKLRGSCSVLAYGRYPC